MYFSNEMDSVTFVVLIWHRRFMEMKHLPGSRTQNVHGVVMFRPVMVMSISPVVIQAASMAGSKLHQWVRSCSKLDLASLIQRSLFFRLVLQMNWDFILSIQATVACRKPVIFSTMNMFLFVFFNLFREWGIAVGFYFSCNNNF